MPASQTALELEFETVLRTGQMKEAFIRLRRQLEQVTAERDGAVAELARLRSQSSQRPQQAPARRPVLTPLREEPPQQAAPPPEPVVEEKKEALDDSAVRFTLLELD